MLRAAFSLLKRLPEDLLRAGLGNSEIGQSSRVLDIGAGLWSEEGGTSAGATALADLALRGNGRAIAMNHGRRRVGCCLTVGHLGAVVRHGVSWGHPITELRSLIFDYYYAQTMRNILLTNIVLVCTHITLL